MTRIRFSSVAICCAHMRWSMLHAWMSTIASPDPVASYAGPAADVPLATCAPAAPGRSARSMNAKAMERRLNDEHRSGRIVIGLVRQLERQQSTRIGAAAHGDDDVLLAVQHVGHRRA